MAYCCCVFFCTPVEVCDFPNECLLKSVVLIDPKIDLVGRWIKVISFNLGESEFFEKLNMK